MFIITLSFTPNEAQLARMVDQLKTVNKGPWVVLPKGCTVRYFPSLLRWFSPSWWYWKLKVEKQCRKAMAGVSNGSADIRKDGVGGGSNVST